MLTTATEMNWCPHCEQGGVAPSSLVCMLCSQDLTCDRCAGTGWVVNTEWRCEVSCGCRYDADSDEANGTRGGY
jgi:hypothetical protein